MTDSSKEVAGARLVNAMLERVDVNSLLDQIEPNRLLDRVDVDRLLDRVSVDRLLDRVDVDRLLEGVDVDRLLDGVDVNRLLDDVDVDRLLDRVDVDRLLDRVVVDRLLDRVNVDALVQRVDVEAVTSKAAVGDLVARGTSGVAGSTLNVFRRQAVGFDTLIQRFLDRLLGRDPDSQPKGPSELVPKREEPEPTTTRPNRAVISGFYAGPASRLLAYVIDASVAFTGFGLIAGFIVGAINTVFRVNVEWDWQAGVFGLLVFSVWLFLFFWLGVAIAGRTLGMSVVGIKVVTNEGRPISPGRAAIRAAVLPLSIATFVGLLGIVLDRHHRALHDRAARTTVVYDWGDRPAELPAPLTKWLADRGVDDGARGAR